MVFSTVYLSGAAVFGFGYLLGIAIPGLRRYARLDNLGFELMHFGSRLAMIMVLWPVFAVCLVFLLFERRT